jgi:hypothetical protein
MTNEEANSLAADWVLYWKAPEGSLAREQLEWVAASWWEVSV